MRSRISIVLFAWLLLASSAFAQERYLRPVDEADQDASLLAFREKLIAAAERKDAAYIYSILDPKIQNGFGDRDGVAWFKRDWKLENKNSEFWPKFLAVMKNGGSFWGDGANKMNAFAAPYVYTDWPDDLDNVEHFAIFGSDVNLRKTPDRDGEVIQKLSHNIVKVEGENGGENQKPEWRKVTTLGGITGYVHRDFVRSTLDYRAGFEKKRGRWVMTFFLAGD